MLFSFGVLYITVTLLYDVVTVSVSKKKKAFLFIDFVIAKFISIYASNVI